MYPTHILTMADTFVHENIPSDAYTDTEKIRFLNDGVRALVSEVRDGFPTFGMQSTTISQTLGTETTTLPTGLDRVLQLRDNTNNLEISSGVDMLAKLDSGFALTDKTIYWVDSDKTATWEVWYTKQPAPVHVAVAGAADATSLTFGTNGAATSKGDIWTGKQYDDYYNGMEIYIRDCDTAGYEHQKAAITDYDGATGVATVASWPAGTPDGTITYELLPMIDCEAFASLLAWEVALRVLVTSRDDTIVRARHHPYAVERKVFKRKYFKMQEVTHGHITFRNLESQA